MTNRVLARDIVRAVADETAKVLRGERADWAPIDAKVESMLTAAELDGQIKTLEWVIKPAYYDSQAVRDELARLRAEKARLK